MLGSEERLGIGISKKGKYVCNECFRAKHLIAALKYIDKVSFTPLTPVQTQPFLQQDIHGGLLLLLSRGTHLFAESKV